MRAEFRRKDDDLENLPELFVIADNEAEWSALQLYLSLMNQGRRSLSVGYYPPPTTIDNLPEPPCPP